MHKFFKEYKKSLKDTSVEEFFDLYFFRPISFLMVKVIKRFPITPNQLSILSLITGIISGVFYASGDAKSFMNGGIMYGISHLLDCCDGMIARLKKNGTPVGRIIDGVVDYTSAFAVYVGLGIGLSKSHLVFITSPWILLILSAFFMVIHCIAVDYYRSEFMAHALNKTNSSIKDKQEFTEELKRLKLVKGKYIDKFLIMLYLGYLTIQARKSSTNNLYKKEVYYKSNKSILMMWSGIGITSHIFILMVSSIIYKPEIFFYYAIMVTNVWMLIIWYIQYKTNNKIRLPKKD